MKKKTRLYRADYRSLDVSQQSHFLDLLFYGLALTKRPFSGIFISHLAGIRAAMTQTLVRFGGLIRLTTGGSDEHSTIESGVFGGCDGRLLGCVGRRVRGDRRHGRFVGRRILGIR
jgi:hypothetical protein